MQDFVFESMDVQYTLDRADNGTSLLYIIKTFVAVFPRVRPEDPRMQRRIPDSYDEYRTFPTLDRSPTARATRVRRNRVDDGRLIVTSRADDFVHRASGRHVFCTRCKRHRAFADTDADEYYGT